MSTEAQVEANQQNALKSTGPATDEGKNQSRLNATTHGLTSKTLTDTIVRTVRFQESVARLTAEIQPQTLHQQMFLEQAVLAQMQSRMAFELLDAEMDYQRNIAQHTWVETRQNEARRLLAKINKRPMWIAAEIQRTVAGCQVLLEEWTHLRDSAAQSGPWNDGQINAAYDLMGKAHYCRYPGGAVCPKDCSDLALHQENLSRTHMERLATAITHMTKAEEVERQSIADGSGSLRTDLVLRYIRYISAANSRFGRYFARACGKPTTVIPTPLPIPPAQVVEILAVEPPIEPSPEPTATKEVNPFNLMRAAILALKAEAARDQMTSKRKRLAYEKLLHDHRSLVDAYADAEGVDVKELESEAVAVGNFARRHLGSAL